MKKFLVITVLALFLVLPVMAVTDVDFKTNSAVNVTLKLNGSASGADATLTIKSGAEARSVTINTDGTLDVVNASSTSFQIYSTDATVKAIKIASSSTILSCNGATATTDKGYASTNTITISTSTAANAPIATSTITLISVSNAATYNSSCGAATCSNGYEVSGAGASATCAACTALTGTATYNTDVCGAATCVSGYTLSGSGASAICVPPPAIIGGGGGGSYQTPCTSLVYDEWQTTCANGWQYRNIKSSSPSGCSLTTAQDNDRKRQCTVTPTEPGETPEAPANTSEQIRNIVAEAANVAGHSVAQILAAVGAMQDAKAEANASSKYTTPLVNGLKNVTAEIKAAITNFVNYGTPTTKVLGAGERAGVISSYKAAFGKVPATENEWADAINIGNGRWPTEKNTVAETKAAAEFKTVYKRAPNMQQPNDNAAVTVISYGLRPSARNTGSEKAAIKSFKAIYGHAPVSATAWDIVRAIAYSGAKR